MEIGLPPLVSTDLNRPPQISTHLNRPPPTSNDLHQSRPASTNLHRFHPKHVNALTYGLFGARIAFEGIVFYNTHLCDRVVRNVHDILCSLNEQSDDKRIVKHSVQCWTKM